MQFTEFDIFRVFAWNYSGPIEAIFGDVLHLDQTYWPLIILSATGLAFKNGLYIYLMRQFFRGVPDELEESAYIDGSGVFRTFIKIVLPLSVPMMITIFLFSFSWQWTDKFYTDLLYSNNKMYLLPHLIGKSIPSLNTEHAKEIAEAAAQNTIGLMIIAPLIIVYLFCQRYLVEGIERSGITG